MSDMKPTPNPRPTQAHVPSPAGLQVLVCCPCGGLAFVGEPAAALDRVLAHEQRTEHSTIWTDLGAALVAVA